MADKTAIVLVVLVAITWWLVVIRLCVRAPRKKLYEEVNKPVAAFNMDEAVKAQEINEVLKNKLSSMIIYNGMALACSDIVKEAYDTTHTRAVRAEAELVDATKQLGAWIDLLAAEELKVVAAADLLRQAYCPLVNDGCNGLAEDIEAYLKNLGDRYVRP